MQNIANRYKIVTCHDSRAVEASWCNNFCIDKGVASCDTRTFYQHRVRNVGGKLSVKWAPGTSEWLNWQYIQSKGLGPSFTNDLWEYIWNLTKILYVLILIPTVHSGHNFEYNTTAEQLRYVCSQEKKQQFACSHLIIVLVHVAYDVITGKRFWHYWSFRRRIHRSPTVSPPIGPVMWSFDISFLVSGQAVEQTDKLPVMAKIPMRVG